MRWLNFVAQRLPRFQPTLIWSATQRGPFQMLGKISVTFDLSGISLLGADNSACHWAMSYGNDTIEGQCDPPSEVPAPAAFGLALLAALGLLRRRRG